MWFDQLPGFHNDWLLIVPCQIPIITTGKVIESLVSDKSVYQLVVLV